MWRDYSATGALTYVVEISHAGLNKYRTIRRKDLGEAERIASAQLDAWDAQWERQQQREQDARERRDDASRRQRQREQAARLRENEAEKKRQERERALLSKEQKRQSAEDATSAAQRALDALASALRAGLARRCEIDWDSLKDHAVLQPRARELELAVDWESLKDRSEFAEPRPQRPAPPRVTPEPTAVDPKYSVHLSLIDRVFPSRARRKDEAASRGFRADHEAWSVEKKRLEAEHRAAELEFARGGREWIARKEAFLAKQMESNAEVDRQRDEYLRREAEANEAYLREVAEARDTFLANQTSRNLEVDKRKQEYLAGNSDAVVGYCDAVLAGSSYPDSFPKDWQLDYQSQTRTLIVEYSLPPLETLPSIKEVKYVQSRDDFLEVKLKEGELNRLFDDLLYQIALLTVHELFSADKASLIDAIAFNGWVRSVDKATGQEVNACILSLMTTRPEFEKVNLAQVEPKACFRTLKGVGSSKLHALAPVKPILQMNREDPRFIAAYEVADSLDDSVNIAAMDWQDFEHLIREVVAEEFRQDGGEVKVTRASRDGGVDAVAFDPDPIRGGKIVIQAKRYTGTVGLDAVRDLYGTVINEGATKGILITTADYGPEAYNFAKDKPLTLLNGGNLLHLLQKHGHRAKIDLKEAKVILKEQEKP